MNGKKYIVSTLLIMAFIFFQSSLSADLSGAESGFIMRFLVGILGFEPTENVHFMIRKLAHFTEYTFLGISLALLFHKSPLIAWSIGAAYSVTDELHQSFVPGRSCEIRDMIIDSLGVLLGVLIICLIRILKPRETEETE